MGSSTALDVNAVCRRRGGGWVAKYKTALDLALERDHTEAAAYLRGKLGAKRAADL